MISAWDNYPSNQFPGLWEWMSERMMSGEFRMSRVASDEVKHKTPECGQWLKDHDVTLLPISPDTLLEAHRIKGLLGIDEEDYHVKGVNENDLLIIATARLSGSDLVSDEARQFSKPKDLRKRKIPAVCEMETIEVQCLSFLELIKGYGAVFR